ncbi:MAG: hypothetical protein KJO41_09240 [Bacteroidia bacterium]|nr:hypothetical protein [Bacteroidia bacterium]NND24788.1 hypothetical protein [Flavobacteriaceae bacterium]NNM35665.1 hypothetical protein [Nitrosopumilus sp.]MBT8279175.1 hypothetical protein [Bacteroidia bacterium]NNK60863.1 hypothetical protein [Flavobacteriaceae bacterium]
MSLKYFKWHFSKENNGMQLLNNINQIKDCARLNFKFNRKNASAFDPLDQQIKNDENETVIIDQSFKLLKKNLKHLEFIAHMETYLENKNPELFSLDFLQNLELVKKDVQKNTLLTSRRLNQNLSMCL